MGLSEEEILAATVGERKPLNSTITLVAYDPGDGTGRAEIPLLEGKMSDDGMPRAYVCRNFTCRAPTTEPRELAEQLSR